MTYLNFNEIVQSLNWETSPGMLVEVWSKWISCYTRYQYSPNTRHQTSMILLFMVLFVIFLVTT